MKKVLSLVTAAVLLLTVGGCAKNSSNASGSAQDKKEIVVGATPVPHEEILEFIKPILAKEGYTLTIKQFNDYVLPNTELNDGGLDANFFQHIQYLDSQVKTKNLNLTYTAKVHIEPMGLYSKKIKSLAEIKDGATIAVPNDPSNEARAFKLLQANGLIKFTDGDSVTKLSITDNPKHLNIQEMDAKMIAKTLVDVDAAVINSNFAMAAGIDPTKDSIVKESNDSPYVNVLAVRKGDENKPYIQALTKALTSPEVKKFIEDKYKGAVIPAF